MTTYQGEEVFNAFSVEYREYLPEEFKILIKALNIDFVIGEVAGAGGETSLYDDSITIPTDTGPGIVLMNTQFGYTTFHQYEKDSTLIHEIGHVILSKLGIGSINTDELNNAILAAAAREAIATAGNENLSGIKEEFQKLMGVNYKEAYDHYMYYYEDNDDIPSVGDNDYNDYEKAIKNLLNSAKGMWSDQKKLEEARTPDASFENSFNLNRDVFEVAGLSGDEFLYRTGYASHEDIGIYGNIDHDEWTSFGAGQAKGIVPGNGATLIKEGKEGEQGIAWLGNQYTNILTTGNADDYIDGGYGDDTLKGMGGIDTLIGGEGSDTIYGGSGDDTIYTNTTIYYVDKETEQTINTVFAGEGEDTIFGSNGKDIIYADADRKDNQNQYSDKDTLEGGKGNDTYYVGNQDTILDSDGEGKVFFEGTYLTLK